MAREGNVKVNVLGDVSNLSKNLKKGADDVGTFAKGVSTSLKGNIDSVIQSLTGRFGALGQEAGKSLSGLASTITGSLGVAGTAGVAGVAALGAAIVAMGAEGIKSFLELASQVKNFQRVSGASVHDSSEFIAIFKAIGIDADTGSAAIFRLAKNVNTHADALAADGIQIAKNKDGTADLVGTLLNVGDAYKQAGAGAAGDKVAFDAFGKSGAALIPILGKTREEIKLLAEEAQKHGEILSDHDLAIAKQYKLAMNDLSESAAGLERNIGSFVIPVLAKQAKGLSAVIDKVREWGSEIKQTATGQQEASSHAKTFDDVLEEQSGAADDAADSIKALDAAIKTYLGITTGVEEAQLGFNQALIDAKEAAVQGGHSLDTNTKAGIANNLMLDGLVDKAATATQSMIDNGKTADQQAVSLYLMAEAARKTATDMGYTAGQADELAKKILGIPTSHTTDVDVDTSPAEQSLARFVDLVNTIDRQVAQNLGRAAAHNQTNPADIAAASRSVTGTEAKATGGPVMAGSPYRVGEKSAETFVPTQNGVIVPSAGPSLTIHVTTNAKPKDIAREVLWQLGRVA